MIAYRIPSTETLSVLISNTDFEKKKKKPDSAIECKLGEVPDNLSDTYVITDTKVILETGNYNNSKIGAQYDSQNYKIRMSKEIFEKIKQGEYVIEDTGEGTLVIMRGNKINRLKPFKSTPSS
ncbi:hypothetical protein HYV50_02840 [Candidatus Pacearchaeota archaeon]|nr:hypothetical protein [Candidatus Pacearchaeota archaeon]